MGNNKCLRLESISEGVYLIELPKEYSQEAYANTVREAIIKETKGSDEMKPCTSIPYTRSEQGIIKRYVILTFNRQDNIDQFAEEVVEDYRTKG